jgi:putative FmdB family regulatory protein
MPTYEYRCTACEAITEMERPIADRKKPVKCCKCGKKTVKQISLCTFCLTGTCWSSDGFTSNAVK